ncbi:MAG TPA: hypothetical protein VGQ83_29130 [Polyangia bacterium]|jgi:hypothetical protein
MSDGADIRDDIREAGARLRGLAARSARRKQEAETELATLEPKLRQVRGEADAVRAAGATALAAQYDAVVRELQTLVDARRGELALADQALRDARAELRELERAEGAALRLRVQEAAAAEPFARAPEEIALANARAGLADVEAELKLEEELAPPRPAAAPPPAHPAEPAPDELAAVKGELAPDGIPPAPARSKRTM